MLVNRLPRDRQQRRWMHAAAIPAVVVRKHRPSALSKESVERMVACVERSGVAAEASTYARLLQACARLKALAQGQRIHAHILSSHSSSGSSSTLVLNHLINMYGKCGRVEEARAVFASMEHPNLVSWNTIIAAHAAGGDGRGALAVFRAMQLEASVVPDRVSFTSVANACGSAREARIIHASVAARGFLDDVIVCTAVITAYCRCSSLGEARATFDAMAPRARNVVTWTALIAGYAQSGHLEEALDLFWSMAEHDGGGGETWSVAPNAVTIVTVVNLCAEFAALEQGKAIHDRCIHAAAIRDDPSVTAALVNMYGRCQRLDEAFAVFDAVQSPTALAWNAIICACARNGRSDRGLELFHRMMAALDAPEREVGVATLCAALVACGESGLLDQGRSVHDLIRRRAAAGTEPSVQIGTSLITMYAKCGSIEDARLVFDSMAERNEVSWNAMLSGYSQHGHGAQLLHLFRAMLQGGVQPNAVTLLPVVNACSSLAQLRQADEWCTTPPLAAACDAMLCNALVYMYGKLGSVEDAWSMFHRCSIRNAVTWNGLITAYARRCSQGQGGGGGFEAEEAMAGLQLLRQMHLEGVPPDRVTFISLCGLYNKLTLLGSPGMASEQPQQPAGVSSVLTVAAKEMVAQILDTGLEWDAAIGTGLISLLGKCGDVDGAAGMFAKMAAVRGGGGDVVPWNAMMGACVLNAQPWRALHLYKVMQLHGVKPDATSAVCLLSDACLAASRGIGEWLESGLSGSGVEEEVAVRNACINMHAKRGDVDRAAAIFASMVAARDVISWNVMMAGYANAGRGDEAVVLLRQMEQHGFHPDRVTYVNFLNACDKAEMVEHGRSIHGRIVLQSRDTPALSLRTNAVVGCSLCSMYARCGSIDEAAAVFAGMEQRNVVSWNAMIGAYAQHGRARLALAVFGGMQQHGVKPDAITLISVLDACAGAGDARRGSQVHGWSLQLQLRSAALDNAAVNMYAKSGRVAAAREVFEAMDAQRRTIMSWSAMVAAYAGVGHAEEAFRLFHAMQREGVRPNHVTLISILGACSHAGMLQAGCSCFASMAADYGVWPREEHTGCVVDMLGRAGWVEQAHRLVQRSGAGGGGDAQAWMAVLGACSQQGDTLRGTCVASSLISRHPQAAAAAYVALSNSKLAAPS
ncbi:pentatricopeptide repeat-containing protein At2g39620 [Selaginella moellendorffii]|uniref:pentatricopeptide repeat-containing protein At2g39620 n=1 Tax=Selaginella moellendorffii TaxID=88036 RepID=UPI000D1CDA8B|nr:pentatricopeptide repeat-containing protein At2g39620 [Selaginella moellendorffii]|eukprot:XP_024516308.1 pentatricopeptide repeat-containing protein At2g39620 [Selaginella moellendorffii]